MKGEFTQKGKEAMERFKMESASEVGVTLKQGYNGDLTAREAGSIGGQMVKKMIDAYKMQQQHTATSDKSAKAAEGITLSRFSCVI